MAPGHREWLDVPYGQKDAAKAAGARWDRQVRRWYAPQPGIPALQRWVPAPRTAADDAPPRAAAPAQSPRRTRQRPPPGKWEDLASRRPGHEVLAEASRRGAGADSSWRAGAEGEFLLHEALAGLTDPPAMSRLLGWRETRRGRARWRVLHSVPIGLGHTDIDHMLIGSAGVITINTKNHNSRLRVDVTSAGVTVGGRDTSYIAAARHEADRVRAALRAGALEATTPPTTAAGESTTPLAKDDHAPAPTTRAVWESVAAGARPERGPGAWPPVTPVLAVIGPPLHGQDRPTGVLVTTPKTLPRLLSALPEALDETAAAAVFDLARRSSTWVRDI